VAPTHHRDEPLHVRLAVPPVTQRREVDPLLTISGRPQAHATNSGGLRVIARRPRIRCLLAFARLCVRSAPQMLHADPAIAAALESRSTLNSQEGAADTSIQEGQPLPEIGQIPAAAIATAQEAMRAVHSARIASIWSPERAVMTLSHRC
jgi:hypothetical protein